MTSAHKNEDLAESMAEAMVGPFLRHGILNRELARKTAGDLPGNPSFHDFAMKIKGSAQHTLVARTEPATEILTAQATSLDALFTELARRSTTVLDTHPDAAAYYLRLALKAQANCRATLETLAKLHQPREQIVRHVHVNEGAQAVIADEFHHHSGGYENEKKRKQPHAPKINETSPCGALPSSDSQRADVPSTSRSRGKTLQDARRQPKRSPKGQPECLETRRLLDGY